MPGLPTGTVTLLFTDIEGSTRLLHQLGQKYSHVLSECRHLLRESFDRWHGHGVDTQGDAFLVAFARATDALSAAVDAQRALAAHPWPDGVRVRVRMCLHTGEPTLSNEGYVGLDVHRAARIMHAGHGGQVLLSQTTRDLVEHDLPEGVRLRDLGAHRLKDLQYPNHFYQLVIVDLPTDFPPLKTIDTHPNNLPTQPTPFIGREQEVAAVGHQLRREEVRLLTLTGPGGIGKTRMALQVATELSEVFPDGIFFVDLAPIKDPALVVPTIAQTFGMQEVGGQALLERLKESLHQQKILLLLDNFEQVVIAAVQVADLLAACPRLKVVVTSREVLHVQAECEFAVPPLALPNPRRLSDLAVLRENAAMALFIQRAQSIRPDFQLTNANARAVVEICARLDGLPLAIELAAARMKLLSPQALLARLNQRFAVLTGRTRDVPVRQQALRNTMEWSYSLLNAAEQQLFRRLSVFVGGCTLEAIEALCATLDNSNGGGRVLDGIASLIDKSLLQQTELAVDEPRLVMLETIREFGWEVLTASGEMGMTRQAHAEFYLKLAEEAELELRGAQSVLWLERLEREHDNLSAVMQCLLEQERTKQRKEMALRLEVALEKFWYVRGPYSEGRAFLEQALTGSEGVTPPVRAKALYASGEMESILGNQDRSQILYEESLALSQSLGDTPGIARALYGLGWVAWHRGNYSTARQLSTEALALWREVGDKERVASTLDLLGLQYALQGEPEKARALYEESLALHRESGYKDGIAYLLFLMAQEHFHSQGDPMAVHSLLEESLSLYKEGGYTPGMANCFALSAQVALSQGDVATARSLHEESLAIARKTGNKGGIAIYLEELASVVAAQGELIWAACLWGSAEMLREATGVPQSPFERVSYDRSVAAARTRLGEKAFAAAWVEGRMMTPEQALTAKAMVPTTMTARPASASPMKSPPSSTGLSAREVEVLRLVAQGMTNEQVATQLVISARTVNTHLTSIYGKIGVSSRSAATRYAIDHHLV